VKSSTSWLSVLFSQILCAIARISRSSSIFKRTSEPATSLARTVYDAPLIRINRDAATSCAQLK
jgi:hypothetical protein